MIVDLLLADEPQAHSVADAIAVLDKVPPPIKITEWDRVSDRFARLAPAEQSRFGTTRRSATSLR
ncbi:hypothetical protein J8J40_28230, partial [Mycobacterium tuberculosis]|nr:hypothetical protein [Mycobacterium tuberculosis]